MQGEEVDLDPQFWKLLQGLPWPSCVVLEQLRLLTVSGQEYGC